ncbi:hypothetical protein DFH28DRAFT_1092589 [Melampsora americana]|nr:hypothetical protein DFH28DRAFT_1092589 [Melampsora americana]
MVAVQAVSCRAILYCEIVCDPGKASDRTAQFRYVKDQVIGLEDCKNDNQYSELLRSAAEELVQQIQKCVLIRVIMHKTNADAVIAFNSRVRDQDANSEDVGCSAKHVIEEAINTALKLNHKEAERFNTLDQDETNNIWRPLEIVRKNPLALCNWGTVDIDKDQHAYSLIQEPGEVAMFELYDSSIEGHMTLPHASFQGPKDEDLPARRSAEVRVMAVFSKDSDTIKNRQIILRHL